MSTWPPEFISAAKSSGKTRRCSAQAAFGLGFWLAEIAQEEPSMLPMLADENFNNDIVRGVRRRSLSVDIVRVQDVQLSGADDRSVLQWAAENQRVLLTHDVSTITRFAHERVRDGRQMPGVFEVSRKVPLAVAIAEILLLAECSDVGEWEGQVRYLPLQ
jgi:hypothetical protein